MIYSERKLKCGDCCVCCSLPHLKLLLEEEEIKDAEFYKAVPYNPPGAVAIVEDALKEVEDEVLRKVVEHLAPIQQYEVRKKRDGTCIHLRGGKCSIYERRPTNCAGFDCRYVLRADEGPKLYRTPDQLQVLKALTTAAKAMNTKMKQSLARRFNDLLKV